MKTDLNSKRWLLRTRSVYVRLLCTLLLLLCNSVMLLAQGVSVSGVVVDLNGESLPGVNVVEVGTNNGTITDFDGRFVLNVSSS